MAVKTVLEVTGLAHTVTSSTDDLIVVGLLTHFYQSI